MGETSDRQGSPVIQLRSKANARNHSTYVALIWKRLRRQIMADPNVQITSIGQTKFPHWMLSPATVPEARMNMATMPKLDGFQICRSWTRSTTFAETES